MQSKFNFELSRQRDNGPATLSLGVPQLVSVNSFVDTNCAWHKVVPPERKELAGAEPEQNEQTKDQSVFSCQLPIQLRDSYERQESFARPVLDLGEVSLRQGLRSRNSSSMLSAMTDRK